MNPIIVLVLFQSAGISPKHYLIETKQDGLQEEVRQDELPKEYGTDYFIDIMGMLGSIFAPPSPPPPPPTPPPPSPPPTSTPSSPSPTSDVEGSSSDEFFI
ncbi:HVA22-like protein h isoform X2 [Eurytemora carolleeae]|nr:HVA22-like protein h isoform X2 [Eurytemora carolleeae]|eukprot:XP_023333573.1 HVA22-like protein h isoform X2 [Eurytemora affinis]